MGNIEGGIVQRALNQARNPKSHEENQRIQDARNKAVHDFMIGNLELSDLRNILSQYPRSEDSIILSYSGPFYGLLRRIGLPQQDAEALANEERAHFYAAQQQGLDPVFMIEFTRTADETAPEFFFTAAVWYDIPLEDEETVRAAQWAVCLAPPHPSRDDFAKLPTPEEN